MAERDTETETTVEEDTASDNATARSNDQFPSLSIALEEARRRFDQEKQRRNSLESKASIVIGADALIVALATSFLNVHVFLLLAILILAMASAYFSLQVLELQQYARAGKEIDDFVQYAKESPSEATKQLLISYINATERNRRKNSDKVTAFTRSYYATFFAIVMTGVAPIIQTLVL